MVHTKEKSNRIYRTSNQTEDCTQKKCTSKSQHALLPAEAVLEDEHQTEDNEDNYYLLGEGENDRERNESRENEESSRNHLLSNTREMKIEDLEEDHVYHILEGPGVGDHESTDEKRYAK